MTEQKQLFLDLVVAMLAVNRWTLDRAVSLTKALREAGLSDPAAVRSMSVDEVAARLAKAGYKRGQYMQQLLATRIGSAAKVLDEHGIRRVTELERRGDKSAIRDFLLTVKGIGPEVANSFLILRS
jgi:endonuclease III-like uncharacterized protein